MEAAERTTTVRPKLIFTFNISGENRLYSLEREVHKATIYSKLTLTAMALIIITNIKLRRVNIFNIDVRKSFFFFVKKEAAILYYYIYIHMQ